MPATLFQVARLTRPSRLRCRPHLASIILSRHLAGSATATARTQDLEFRKTLHGRSEVQDYETSLEIGRGVVEDREAHAIGMRRSRLPSLFKYMPKGGAPKAAQDVPEPESDSVAQLVSAEADAAVAAETATRSETQAVAGPSRLPDVPEDFESVVLDEPAQKSRKGKERAVPSTRSRRKAPTLFDMAEAAAMRDASSGSSVQLEQATPPSPPGPRRNPVGVQLLSKHMHAQLFPGAALPSPTADLINISKQHLSTHGLSPDGAGVLPEISFDLPRLEGENIRQHFHTLGAYAAEPYLSMAKEFAEHELPPMPAKWVLDRPGWTKYAADGTVTAVDNLAGETMVCFDVETLYKLSKYPVMATAASKDAWYSWLSPQIFEDPPEEGAGEPVKRDPWDLRVDERHPRTLIPLFPEGSTAPSIVVGHNVGYDRGRVKEEYALERTPTRWLDTLSLHVATRGITSVQRPAWIKHRNTKRDKYERDSEAIAVLRAEAEASGDTLLAESIAEWSASLADDGSREVNTWEETTSVNSLAEVAKLHCGIQVDKSVRDRFGDESITHASQLRSELDELLSYCAADVKITHDVYKVVLPLFLNSCPHPATFAGVLSMGNSFLPVDKAWGEYLKSAETMYRTLREDVRLALRTLADRLRKEGPKADDPWSSQLDWTPKAARWPDEPSAEAGPAEPEPKRKSTKSKDTVPAWYAPIAADPNVLASTKYQRYMLPLLLQMSFRGYPVYYLQDHMWCFRAPLDAIPDLVQHHGLPVEPGPKDTVAQDLLGESVFFRIAPEGGSRRTKLTGKTNAFAAKSGLLTSPHPKILNRVVYGSVEDAIPDLVKLANKLQKSGSKASSEWDAQLNWDPVGAEEDVASVDVAPVASRANGKKKKKDDFGTWPKWYWDLSVPVTNKKVPARELDLTMRKAVAPLLLRMQWHGYPLAYSKEHKWLYRVPKSDVTHNTNGPLDADKAVSFKPVKGDEHLDTGHAYFRIPHKDGEGNNVGNPLSKAFLKAVESGELSSALSSETDQQLASAAATATNMNALCSYWISSRERIMNQFVVYDDKGQGMILPQVITMGTVTRRAVEATWLTASNAKKNRVGSELKSMVRAPPGYAIVGADVDSEELWISSVMGDSQFGFHGATAIGWMTLEGTKSAGTDLHSKTASILHISRDAAKVFNYSRIYGAGKPHAIQLLLQGDGKLTPEAADTLATNLYKQTKGTKTFRSKGKPPASAQYLWHGGSESYLFNTLESIALMDRPTTPALGCGVTRALRKSFLDAGHSYLPSRINWVVQSSGVDYLHLLITAMEYLTNKYAIRARYLLSVHDEVRYLAVEEDKYRAALALQIANAWTRALFCYNLGLDDMPQGIAFFSAVDVDHVLRKETDMTCVTPSHPTAIPPGQSLDINQILERTGGALGADKLPHPLPRAPDPGAPVHIFNDLQSPQHRQFLLAQANATPRTAKQYLDSLPGLPGAVAPAPKKRAATSRKKTAARAPPADMFHPDSEGVVFDGGWSEQEVSEAYAQLRSAVAPRGPAPQRAGEAGRRPT